MAYVPSGIDCHWCKAPAIAVSANGALVCSGHSDMRHDTFIDMRFYLAANGFGGVVAVRFIDGIAVSWGLPSPGTRTNHLTRDIKAVRQYIANGEYVAITRPEWCD